MRTCRTFKSNYYDVATEAGMVRSGRDRPFKSNYYDVATVMEVQMRPVSVQFKSNYYDVATGDAYWISGCKRRGSNRLYGERIPVEIDEEVRREYWTRIRNKPEKQREQYAEM